MQSAPQIIGGKTVTIGPAGLVSRDQFPGFLSRLHRAASRFSGKPVTFIGLGLLASVLPVSVAVTSVGAAMLVGLMSLAENWSFTTAVASLSSVLALTFYILISSIIAAAAAFKVTTRQAIIVGLSRMPWHFLTSVIVIFSIITPALLLVFPALVSTTHFLMILPIVTLEKRRLFSAMNRSYDLVTGHGWRLAFEFAALTIVIPTSGWTAKAIVNAVVPDLGQLFPNIIPSLIPLVTALPGIATAVIFAAFFLPFTIIYLQIFYEDLTREKGWNWVPTPRRIRYYKILTVLGVAALIALPVSGGAYLINRLTRPPVEIILPDKPTPAEEISEVIKPISHDMQRYEDVNVIRIGLAGYFSDELAYPDRLEKLVPKYVKTIPADPDPNRTYDYLSIGNDFQITFTLENGIFDLLFGEQRLTSNGFNVPLEEQIETPIPEQPEVAPQAPEQEIPMDETASAPNQPAIFVEDETTEDNTNEDADPIDAQDSDSDGLTDQDEIAIWKTDPYRADTDQDGFSDGIEVTGGYNPLGDGPLETPTTDETPAETQLVS